MTQQADLLKRLEKLPPQYFGEVINFVEYLQQKAKQEQTDEITQTMAAREWVNPLLGLGKAFGSTLTLERFREMQQEEIAQEIENDERLWAKK